MKRILSFMIIGIMAFSLTACGNSASGNTTQQEAESTLEISERENDTDLNTVPADEVASADNAQQEEADTDSDSNTEGNSILVAYFSLAGEQYKVGVIEEGNTAIIAKMIAEQTGADIFSIESTSDYPDTYDGLLEVSRDEESNPPQIAGTVENMDDYDVVFVGFPIWWGNLPPIIEVFLDSYDFSGKTIVPFCTSHSSGIGSSASDLHSLCPDSVKWLDGKRFGGGTSKEEIEGWLRGIGIL